MFNVSYDDGVQVVGRARMASVSDVQNQFNTGLDWPVDAIQAVVFDDRGDLVAVVG